MFNVVDFFKPYGKGLNKSVNYGRKKDCKANSENAEMP